MRHLTNPAGAAIAATADGAVAVAAATAAAVVDVTGGVPGAADTVTVTVETAGTESVRIRITADSDFIPQFASAGAAGADLRARLERSLVLPPGERVMIGTGVRVEIPRGYEGQVRPRSGLAARQGITVLNSPGTIDSDYRGEIRVPLINLGREPVTIEPLMRIAQLVITPVPAVVFVPDTAISETDRGEGGFGSTGVQ